MSGRKILGGISVLAGGQTLAYAMSFLRNVILARMLTQADFGLAAVFALAVGMIELAGKMAIGRQVVQDVEGDSQKFLNTAHAFQVLAAAISAVLLLLLCNPVAHLFKVPEKAWAFALLALVPLLRGLENLDFHRRQRQLVFLPSVWVELVPQIIVTALAYPLTKWIGDFRVVLVLILFKSLLTLTMTHVLALRRYRWGWDKALASSMWYFSWPLIINGLLMYVSQQGDKLIVSTGFSLEVLSLYAICAMFISVPKMVLAHASSFVMLPLLASVQTDDARFNREYLKCLELNAFAAVVLMIPFILGGEQIIKLFFGARYSGGGLLMAWLAAACGFRLLRTTPANAAMARADTKNNLFTNLFRNISFLFAIVVVVVGGTVASVAACMLLGELVAMAVSGWLLKKRLGIPVMGAIRSSLYCGICLVIAGVMFVLGSGSWSLSILVFAIFIMVLTCLALAWYMFQENAKQIFTLVYFHLNRVSFIGKKS